MSPDSIQSSVLKKPPTPNTQRRLVKTNSTDRSDVQSAPPNMEQIGNLIGRLVSATDDIRQFQKSFGEDRERERMRRNRYNCIPKPSNSLRLKLNPSISTDNCEITYII